MDDYALRQVETIVRILPIVDREECFALKGGTAINLFVEDLPRLSVDIDLFYLPIQDRPTTLKNIHAAMHRMAERLSTAFGGRFHATPRIIQDTDGIARKVDVQSAERVHVKIETSPVTRGCVFDPERREVTPIVNEKFGFARVKVVSLPDLYAGKIVAALDRQHPRDLFDVWNFFGHNEISDHLRDAFVVYLLCSRRPLHALLSPNARDISSEFEHALADLVNIPVTVAELQDTRESIVSGFVGEMPEAHQKFLVSYEEGTPEWDLLNVPHARRLPAVLWRSLNAAQLDASQRNSSVAKLESALTSAPRRNGSGGSGAHPCGPSGP